MCPMVVEGAPRRGMQAALCLCGAMRSALLTDTHLIYSPLFETALVSPFCLQQRPDIKSLQLELISIGQRAQIICHWTRHRIAQLMSTNRQISTCMKFPLQLDLHSEFRNNPNAFPRCGDLPRNTSSVIRPKPAGLFHRHPIQ